MFGIFREGMSAMDIGNAKRRYSTSQE